LYFFKLLRNNYLTKFNYYFDRRLEANGKSIFVVNFTVKKYSQRIFWNKYTAGRNLRKATTGRYKANGGGKK